MILRFHPGLTTEKWRALSWDKRLLNIGAEFSRTQSAIHDQNVGLANQALERALELMDLTVESGMQGKSDGFLSEFLRFREAIAGFYVSPKKEEKKLAELFEVFLSLDPVVHNLGLEI